MDVHSKQAEAPAMPEPGTLRENLEHAYQTSELRINQLEDELHRARVVHQTAGAGLKEYEVQMNPPQPSGPTR